MEPHGQSRGPYLNYSLLIYFPRSFASQNYTQGPIGVNQTAGG